MKPLPNHSSISRRTAVQAGAVGLLGLGMNHLDGLRNANAATANRSPKSCIYIFLSGGLAQQDSFDLKPNAPDTVRGEFNPIATKTPGIQICEHLPRLAERSEDWALVRSLTHPTNGHTLGHFYMLTGRTDTPPGFRGDRVPRPTDWPSIASVVGDVVPAPNNNLPPAVVLPERLVHWSGGVIPGAYGGVMGSNRDPFFVEATNYGDPFWRGAYPEYTFFQLPKKTPKTKTPTVFQAPNLKLATDMIASDSMAGSNCCSQSTANGVNWSNRLKSRVTTGNGNRPFHYWQVKRFAGRWTSPEPTKKSSNDTEKIVLVGHS